MNETFRFFWDALEIARQHEYRQRDLDDGVNFTDIARSHIIESLKSEIEHLQNVLINERKDQELQIEQKSHLMKLEHEKLLQSERQKATEIKKTLESQVEELKVEIIELNEEVGRKTVEITRIEADHSEKWIENENRLKTEYEEKIKKMQVGHYEDIAEREMIGRKLAEENKSLKIDFDNLKNDHEKNILKREHQHRQEVQNLIEEVKNNWSNKYMMLERESKNIEKGILDEIALMTTKNRGVLMENEKRWQLLLKQKQTEMDLMKENLEKNLEEANEKNSALEGKHLKENFQLKKEAQMKLNEKETELTKEFKKKLDERVNILTGNLKYEMRQKEKDHQYKMETKDMELATLKESLARAQAKKSDLHEKLRKAVKNETEQAQTQTLTMDEESAPKESWHKAYQPDSNGFRRVHFDPTGLQDVWSIFKELQEKNSESRERSREQTNVQENDREPELKQFQKCSSLPEIFSSAFLESRLDEDVKPIRGVKSLVKFFEDRKERGL